MDMGVIPNALLSIAAIAVSTAVPVLIPPLLKRLKIASDTDLARRIETVADAAAGVAYQYALTRSSAVGDPAAGLGNPQVHNAAISLGTNYVLGHVPDTVAQLGVGHTDVAEMVSARLGRLLAADATVSAGAPTSMPTLTPAAPPRVSPPVPPIPASAV